MGVLDAWVRRVVVWQKEAAAASGEEIRMVVG
jgi:hypothetical protein